MDKCINFYEAIRGIVYGKLPVDANAHVIWLLNSGLFVLLKQNCVCLILTSTYFENRWIIRLRLPFFLSESNSYAACA